MIGISCCLKKCPVLPVSAMVEITKEFDDSICGCAMGGPIEENKETFTEFLAILFVTIVSFLTIGSPRPHAVAGTAGVVRGGRTNTWDSPRRRWIWLQPPFMLLMVASLQCPGALRLHVALVCSELRVNP